MVHVLLALILAVKSANAIQMMRRPITQYWNVPQIIGRQPMSLYRNLPQVIGRRPLTQYRNVPQVIGRRPLTQYWNVPQVIGSRPMTQYRNVPQVMERRLMTQYRNVPQVIGRRPLTQYWNVPQVIGSRPMIQYRNVPQVIERRPVIQYRNVPVNQRHPMIQYRNVPQVIERRPMTQYRDVPQVIGRPMTQYRNTPHVIERRPMTQYRNPPQFFGRRPMPRNPPFFRRPPETQKKNVPQIVINPKINYTNEKTPKNKGEHQYKQMARKQNSTRRPKKLETSSIPKARSRSSSRNYVTTARAPVISNASGNGKVVHDVWLVFGKREYMVKRNAKSFDDAEESCKKSGAHLVSIHSEEENNFIHRITSTGSKIVSFDEFVYIGLRLNPKNEWEWSDGSGLNYKNWAEHQPDQPHIEKCAQFHQSPADLAHVQDYKWNSISCNLSMKYYVCKKDQQQKSDTSSTRKAGKVVYDVWLVFGKREYMVKRNAKSFDDAEASCKKLDAHLVSIHSEEENNFIHKITSTGSKIKSFDEFVYIGLRLNPKNEWEWLDRSGLIYKNWAEHQPDQPHIEKCAQFHQGPANLAHVQDYKWNSISCNLPMKYYVCKKNQRK